MDGEDDDINYENEWEADDISDVDAGHSSNGHDGSARAHQILAAGTETHHRNQRGAGHGREERPPPPATTVAGSNQQTQVLAHGQRMAPARVQLQLPPPAQLRHSDVLTDAAAAAAATPPSPAAMPGIGSGQSVLLSAQSSLATEHAGETDGNSLPIFPAPLPLERWGKFSKQCLVQDGANA